MPTYKYGKRERYFLGSRRFMHLDSFLENTSNIVLVVSMHTSHMKSKNLFTVYTQYCCTRLVVATSSLVVAICG